LWLKDNPFKSSWHDPEAAIGAVMSNNLDLLKWLCEQRCYLSTEVFCKAVQNFKTSRNFEILEFLYEKGCPWDEKTMHLAVDVGLEVVKWLHERGCPWKESATYSAAQLGHFEILKYLHENGCPWSARTTVAAGYSNLPVLEYFEECGLDLSGVWSSAVYMWKWDVLKWGRDRGYHLGVEISDILTRYEMGVFY